MHRCLALAICIAAMAALPAATASAAESPAAVCAEKHATEAVTETLTTGPATMAPSTVQLASTLPGGIHPADTSGGLKSCWVEEPYPFISEAGVEATGPPGAISRELCQNATTYSPPERCYEQVESMTFKAWNEGRALTTTGTGKSVWFYDSEGWAREPTFSQVSKSCGGETKIIPAGKKDYWLIGDSSGGEGKPWPGICRYDGETGLWSFHEIPKSTTESLQYSSTEAGAQVTKVYGGGITSGACFEWNDCWFFGSYGVVLHWSEEKPTCPASAASEPPSLGLHEVQGPGCAPTTLTGGQAATAAASSQTSLGKALGLAVDGYSEGRTVESTGGLGPRNAEDETPSQLYSSIGGSFSPVAMFTPPRLPSGGFDTELVAVAIDSQGQGWAVGGGQYKPQQGELPRPAPIIPVSIEGESSACVKQPFFVDAYYEPNQVPAEGPDGPAVPGSFEWLSLAVIPGSGEGMVAGHLQPLGSRPRASSGEPVIAQVSCDGPTTLTRLKTEELKKVPNEVEEVGTGKIVAVPGEVTAIAASAPNDAWAAVGAPGELARREFADGAYESPRLYHYWNGAPPEAEAGNELDSRTRPSEPPPITEPSAPPEPPPPPAPKTVTHKKTIKLAPSIYDVKAALHTSTLGGHPHFSLYITFKLRRAVTVGAHALRGGHVVSAARPKHFSGRTGTLILTLTRQNWPTKVTFVA